MGNLGGTFDANSVAPRQEFTTLDPGEYLAMIVASEVSENAKRDGSFLKLELEIIDGPAKGRKLFDRLNLNNPNAQAVEIAKATLSAICHAIGKLTVSDSTELHNAPMLAVVRKVPKKQNGVAVPGEFDNAISTYKPKSAGQTAASGIGGGAGAPPAAGSPSTGGGLPWANR
jgi:hypothetical protein